MRACRLVLSCLAWSVALGACAGLDEPTGRSTAGLVAATPAPAPDVMVLLDVSGSMNLPADPTSAACPAGCGAPGSLCPAACPTRLTEAQLAMNGWLDESPAARLALTTYPAGQSCGAPSAVSVDFPAPGAANDLGALRTHLAALVPSGGTPTSAALAFVGALPAMQDSSRQRAVVLITDGLPNCNDTNPNSICSPTANVAACQCTVGSCFASLCSLGCLDDDGTTQTITALAAQGIETVVVGFGEDANLGAARGVFSRMALAGGPRDARAAFDHASLKETLDAVTRELQPRACTFTLARLPTSDERLVVEVEGREATWQSLGSGRVHVEGPCAGATFRIVR